MGSTRRSCGIVKIWPVGVSLDLADDVQVLRGMSHITTSSSLASVTGWTYLMIPHTRQSKQDCEKCNRQDHHPPSSRTYPLYGGTSKLFGRLCRRHWQCQHCIACHGGCGKERAIRRPVTPSLEAEVVILGRRPGGTRFLYPLCVPSVWCPCVPNARVSTR